MASIKGIDISHHQGNPDFARVKAAGVRFVMLKATEGVVYVDPCFHANIRAAQAAGLPVGAYHFLRSGSAADQADDFLAAIRPYRITWPAAVDVEHAELTALGRDRLTDMVLDFCARVEAAGYRPAVYSNRNWLYLARYLDADRIRAAGVPIWVAWYTDANNQDNTDRSDLCDLWQYASDGSVDGIGGNVDLDVSYRDFGVPQYTCDTSNGADNPVVIPMGGCYTAKTTGDVQLVAGKSPTSARVQIIRCIQHGYILWHIVPFGDPGQSVGIYAEGGPKLFVCKIE